MAIIHTFSLFLSMRSFGSVAIVFDLVVAKGSSGNCRVEMSQIEHRNVQIKTISRLSS